MTQEQDAIPDLAQMEARIEELGKKDELSPTELKELVYLIWDKSGVEEDDYGSYGGTYLLPSGENPTIQMFVGEPADNDTDITILDGLMIETSLSSGEVIRLKDVEEQLNWHDGFYLSFYSKLFDRTVRAETTDLEGAVLSQTPLSPKDLGKVGKIVFKAYQESKTSN